MRFETRSSNTGRLVTESLRPPPHKSELTCQGGPDINPLPTYTLIY